MGPCRTGSHAPAQATATNRGIRRAVQMPRVSQSYRQAISADFAVHSRSHSVLAGTNRCSFAEGREARRLAGNCAWTARAGDGPRHIVPHDAFWHTGCKEPLDITRYQGVAMATDALLLRTSWAAGAATLTVRPPAVKDQEGRIRTALGLGREPLPPVGMAWLWKYYEHLSAALRMPFEARCPEDSGLVRPVTAVVSVVGLLPPCDDARHHDSGLWCEARRDKQVLQVPAIDLEVETDHPNAQLIEDYWYWFWNWRFDPRI